MVDNNERITILNLLKPFGPGASAVSLKYIEEELLKRYKENIEQYITYVKIYKEKNGNYYIYIKIPSENNIVCEKKVFYDVIIEFIADPNVVTNKSIDQYSVKVFSNSPSFMFIFTYVYNKKGILLDIVPKKYYSKIALTQPPEIKNKMELLGIEKSLWFAFTYIKHNGLLNKEKLDTKIEKTSIKKIIKEIKSQEDKYKERIKQNDTRIKKEKKNTYNETTQQEIITKRATNNNITYSLKNDMKNNNKNELKSSLTNSLQTKKSLTMAHSLKQKK